MVGASGAAQGCSLAARYLLRGREVRAGVRGVACTSRMRGAVVVAEMPPRLTSSIPSEVLGAILTAWARNARWSCSSANNQ